MKTLTPAAQALHDEFKNEGRGCACHLGGAPCSHCTHPGNPHALEADDSAWINTNRVSPVHLRKVMEAVNEMVRFGIDFVPMPAYNDQDRKELADESARRLELLSAAAEASSAGDTP